MSDQTTICAHSTIKHRAEACPDIQGATISKWYCTDCGAEFTSKKLCQYSKSRLQSELEAERGKVRGIVKEIDFLLNQQWFADGMDELPETCAESYIEGWNEALSAIKQKTLANTTAPTEAESYDVFAEVSNWQDNKPKTEAEIRAQRDKEIADWLDKQASDADNPCSNVVNFYVHSLSRELRQHVDNPAPSDKMDGE